MSSSKPDQKEPSHQAQEAQKATPQQQKQSRQPVRKRDAYPDAASLFAVRPRPIKDIKDDCYIVLDTNVLLIPYVVGAKSLQKIRETYHRLHDRIVIPHQVAREFANRRADKLADLYKSISDQSSKPQKVESKEYPLFQGSEQYQKARDIEQQINKLVGDYRQAMGQVMDEIRRWNWDDPVSLMYTELFPPDSCMAPTESADELENIHSSRFEQRMPPGYSDAAKDDGGIGDLLIWFTILHIGREYNRSVIFVSGEEKSDWWHRSNNMGLYPRFELVEEFYRVSSGRSFHILHFSDFLDLFEADNQVVDEVRKEESASRKSETIQAIQAGINRLDERNFATSRLRFRHSSYLGDKYTSELTMDDIKNIWPLFIDAVEHMATTAIRDPSGMNQLFSHYEPLYFHNGYLMIAADPNATSGDELPSFVLAHARTVLANLLRVPATDVYIEDVTFSHRHDVG